MPTVLKKENEGSSSQVSCIHCGSENVTLSDTKQGFGWGKAIAGGILTGGIGLAAGLINRNKTNISVRCNACLQIFTAEEWKAKHAQRFKQTSTGLVHVLTWSDLTKIPKALHKKIKTVRSEIAVLQKSNLQQKEYEAAQQRIFDAHKNEFETHKIIHILEHYVHVPPVKFIEAGPFFVCLVILLPEIFAWFTLGRNFSNRARALSFSWLVECAPRTRVKLLR